MAEVAAWGERAQLPTTFRRLGLSGADLVAITDEKLTEMGLRLPLAQKKVLDARAAALQGPPVKKVSFAAEGELFVEVGVGLLVSGKLPLGLRHRELAQLLMDRHAEAEATGEKKASACEEKRRVVKQDLWPYGLPQMRSELPARRTPAYTFRALRPRI